MRNDNFTPSFTSFDQPEPARSRWSSGSLRRSTALAALAATGALLLGACGGPTPTIGATGTTTTGRTYAHPSGADEVVLRIHTAGGFVPYDTALGDVAEITVYGDGRVLLLQDGGGAVPVLAEYRVTENGLQRILAAADEAGLLGDEVDYGQPTVTDLPTTVVEVVTDAVHTHGAYALDFEQSGGLTTAQESAREALRDVVADLNGLVEWLGDDAAPAFAPYTPSALSVYSRPLAGGESAGATEEWPLADLATAGEPLGQDSSYRCVAVSGDDLTALVAATRTADPSTGWTVGGTSYRVTFGVVLPDGEPCADPLL